MSVTIPIETGWGDSPKLSIKEKREKQLKIHIKERRGEVHTDPKKRSSLHTCYKESEPMRLLGPGY